MNGPSAPHSSSNGASTPVTLTGVCGRALKGSSNSSRCALLPSSRAAVTPAIAPNVSSATIVVISSISLRLASVNSAAKLWSLRSSPASAQTRVPATRNGKPSFG